MWCFFTGTWSQWHRKKVIIGIIFSDWRVSYKKTTGDKNRWRKNCGDHCAELTAEKFVSPFNLIADCNCKKPQTDHFLKSLCKLITNTCCWALFQRKQNNDDPQSDIHLFILCESYLELHLHRRNASQKRTVFMHADVPKVVPKVSLLVSHKKRLLHVF